MAWTNVRPLYSHHDMGKTLKFRAKNPNQGIDPSQIEYLNFIFPSPKPKTKPYLSKIPEHFANPIKQAIY